MREGRRLFRDMRAISLILTLITIVSPASIHAAQPLSAKEMMEFGLEAAKRGLWREAAFRWERSVKQAPDDAHLRNNLAVAYESLGDLERAGAEYEKALSLDPGNKKIRANYDSFKEIHRVRIDKVKRERLESPADSGE